MNEKGSRENHRMFPRMAAEFSCVVRRVDKNGNEAPHQLVKTRNIGLGGMLIETRDPFAKGDAMRLVIMIGDRRIEARARVIYVKPVAEGLFQYGVEYTDILDENRDFLLAYYLQKEYKFAEE